MSAAVFAGNFAKERQQARRRAKVQQGGDVRPMRRQYIERQIDTVELAVVLGAVLQMIDHLKGRAQRIGIGPGRPVLAMKIEHESPDRHGGVAAIMHQLVPIRVAALGDVARKAVRRSSGWVGASPLSASTRRSGSAAWRCPTCRAESASEASSRQLAAFRQGRVIGDVVGGAREAVEAQDGGRSRGAISSEATGKFSPCSVLLASTSGAMSSSLRNKA